MKGTKHTPGPWNLNGKCKPVERGNYAWIGGIVGSDNATVLTSGTYFGLSAVKPSVLEANALLIAAAPDLLVALREARDYIHALAVHHDITEAEGTLERIDAALAMAAGKRSPCP